jgi:hypothetical protein
MGRGNVLKCDINQMKLDRALGTIKKILWRRVLLIGSLHRSEVL